MGDEDRHLESQFEERNGGLVSTSDPYDELDYSDDYDYQYASENDTHW